jgi:CheY-like chemotaxis protein
VQEDRLRSLGRLTAGVAHEINNPLTFVLANLDSLRISFRALASFHRALQEKLETDGGLSPQVYSALVADRDIQEYFDEAAETLTDCSKGARRIQDIARSLGTFAATDDEEREWVDLTRIVDDACAMVFNQIRYRARLVKRFEPVPLVAGYPGRIAQALVNLLINATEAIEAGSYEEHAVVVSTEQREQSVIVSVTDTGAGVPEGYRSQIFEPGFTTKAEDGGMGLGLSSCRSVAAQHGGSVDYQPCPDRGSRFDLRLPIDSGLSASNRRRESVPVSDAPVERRRLLIVDDDAMVLSALRRHLRRHFDTVTVLGGAEALSRLEEDRGFDAILCDLMMPHVDGKVFYESISEHHPELVERIVFMSGGAFPPRLRKFAAMVSNPVLQKPVSREHLISMLVPAEDKA